MPPVGRVNGEAITELPQDLYIPPDALRVFLEAFEGPLDLLLYLIKKQNVDILDIPVAAITTQYMQYVELMKALNFELAAEYLVMAAMLSEIKSRMLLPRSSEHDEDEELDPRAELILRLQQYERFKQASEDLDALPRVERDIHLAQAKAPEITKDKAFPDVSMLDLMHALNDVFKRSDLFESHQISREKLSTRERMSRILERLKDGSFKPFISLFDPQEGKLGVVVTFLAILELSKDRLIELVQQQPFAPIHVRAQSSMEELPTLTEQDMV